MTKPPAEGSARSLSAVPEVPAAPVAPAASAVDPPATPARGPARLLHPDPVVRRLASLTLINCVGNGLSLAVSVLFFTRVLGLTAAQLGIGLTAAGVCGVAASVPAGRLADRFGTKPVLVVLVTLEAVGTVGYVLVRDYLAFVLLACAVTAVDRGSSAVRNALYAEVLPADRRVAGRAYLRVVTNVGLCLGTALASIALQLDSRPAYLTTILLDALSFAVVAVLYARVPTPGRPVAEAGAGQRSGRRRNPALRNAPFLAVTVLNSVLCLQFGMLEVGVPLWIIHETRAPRIVVAGTLIVNTVLVVCLQVRATRGTEQRALAARACRRGGLLVAGSALVIGLAHGLPPVAAAAVVLGGVALQGFGEVLSQAGGWALSYDLAGEGAHGAYQGVFNAGSSAALMLGPALVTTAVIGNGLLGWALLGAVFAAAGLAMAPVVRWAERRDAGTAPTAVATASAA
ncbi:MFS transporter [Kitasatospora sp. NPDC050543]|uniref:MFS transporter n=1 Tax=Kitasatospora sp. NPDC050543 TaxID=3364054 RepID=UPI0037B426D2